MMLIIYNFISLIALILYLPLLLLKKGPENKLHYFKERLGLSEYSAADIWVHAVSVGEVIAALPFLRELKKEFPDFKIALSTTTYTGQKIAHDKFPDANRIMYMPWDTGLCIKKAVKSMKPKAFLTIETELWPVLFNELKKAGSCIIVLNGRLSQGSFRGYRRVRPFMIKFLSNVHYFYMQSREDAERIILIGAEPSKVGLMGNFKFDVDFHGNRGSAEWLNNLDGKIFVAGSTHKGEDEIILDAYELIKKRVQQLATNLKLIIAPRHPERFNDVEEILKKRKLNFIRRSSLPGHGSRVTGHGQLPDIILLDTIGELSQVYARADISFIGGSLLPYGGHNILEPAYWGNPIIFGPYMDNFPIASDFLQQNAAIEIKSSADMASAIEDVLTHSDKAGIMGQKAKAIVDSNTGAVKKAVELVRSFIGTA